MTLSTTIAKALDQVEPRLKQLRAQRGVTLTALAERTGLSKSTLSRVAKAPTGCARPSGESVVHLDESGLRAGQQVAGEWHEGTGEGL